jgi:hypothetical protein
MFSRNCPSTRVVMACVPAASTSRSPPAAPAISSAWRITSSPARLQRGALHAALAVPRPHEARGAELLRFVDEVVEILARVAAGLRDHEAAHFAAPRSRRGTRRNSTRRTAPTDLQLHARAQVRLVAAEPRIASAYGMRRNGLRRVRADERHQAPISGSRIEKTRFSVAKEISRSTCVNSGWRSARRSSSRKHFAIWKVAIHARDHQDLLEDLRRLRQREELAGMHAARHQVVARPFGRRLGQDRRLDLEEALLVEVLPHRERRLVAQDHVLLEPRRRRSR